MLATLYGNDEKKLETAAAEAAQAFCLGESKVEAPRLIKKIIGI